MEHGAINDVLARRFLLGELSSQEREQIEESAFADPETFALIQAAQQDLIDDFVYGELSPEEKRGFQEYFLAQSGRRQDVRIARALQQYLGQHTSSSSELTDASTDRPRKVSVPGWFRLRPATFALVTAAIFVAVGIGLFLLSRPLFFPDETSTQVQQHAPPSPLPTPDVSPTAEVAQALPSPSLKDNQNKPSPPPRGPRSSIPAIVLVPTTPVRAETDPDFPPVTVSAGSVNFELPVIGSTRYEAYRVELQEDGKTIRSWSHLRAKELQAGKSVQIQVRPGLLKPLRRYRFVLSGVTANRQVQSLNNYHFQITESK